MIPGYRQFLPPLQTLMNALQTQASVALVPATTLWETTLVSALWNICKSTVAITAWVWSVMMRETSGCEKSTSLWEGLLEVSNPWKSVERHVCWRRDEGWVYLKCCYAAVNTAAGLRGPGLPWMVVQVVHCPRKVNMWMALSCVLPQRSQASSFKWICEWTSASLAVFLWCLLPTSFSPTQLQTWGRASASGITTARVGMNWPLTWPGRCVAVPTISARPGIDPVRPAQPLPVVSAPPLPSFQSGPFQCSV